MTRAGALAAALVLLAAPRAQAQDFGENHVVRDDFRWKIRSTEHFDIHYYEGSEPRVQQAAESLEAAFSRVMAGLDIPLTPPPWVPKRARKRYAWKRRPFFLYASPNDFQQSNIAFVGDGTGGVTEPFKDRFMVYNDGSSQWLDEVITHEFVHIAQFHLLIGGFWRTGRILKSILYPLWMIEGMAGYLTHDIESTLEELTIRDAATSGGLLPLTRLEHFGHLKPHQIVLAYKQGAAAMEFLGSQWGRRKPGDMLRLFIARFDTSHVLSELIGLDAFEFDRKYREHLESKYRLEVRALGLREPEAFGGALTRTEGGLPQYNAAPAFSADGKTMYHLTTAGGHPPELRAVDLATGRSRRPRGVGYVPIENISLGSFANLSRALAASPDGRRLAFAGTKNHRDSLYLYDIAARRLERVPLAGLMTAAQPQFSPDSRSLVFSGMKDSFSDLYRYDLETKALERLTDDPADDAMPAFSPDGAWIVYSSEVDGPDGKPRRRLHRLTLKDRSIEPLESSDGEARDPVVSPDGAKVLFILEDDGLSEIAELDLASGKVERLTRTVGGCFTPAYAPGGEIAFATLRRGSVHIYKGPRADFLAEPVAQAPAAARPPAPEPRPAARLTPPRPYRFGYSTDIFIPALFYSSVGGLFLTGYWQGSDTLGDHQTSALGSVQSGRSYYYSLRHGYFRHRPQVVAGADGYGARGLYDYDTGHDVDSAYHSQSVSVAYPLDRYHRLEGAIASASEIRRDLNTGLAEDRQGRAARVSLVRDTVRGRYLVATKGDRLQLSYLRQTEVLGGNRSYSAAGLEAHRFIPLGAQSALALRASAEQAVGPDSPQLILGGLGGVRGYGRSTVTDVGDRLAVLNAEWRFPVAQDINYYMWYIFPDFYFKALFGTLFADAGYAWRSEGQGQRAGWRDVRQSVGVGLRLYTFILQQFPLVISMDYARRTTSGGEIFYVYLGQIF